MQTTTSHANPPPALPAPTLNEPHAVHVHAQRTLYKKSSLTKDGMAVHPNLRLDDVRYALTKVGGGLDHTLGEQAMAFGDFSIDPDEHALAEYLLVTDRRFLGTVGWLSGAVCNARFREIEEVRFKKGMLSVELKVRCGQVWHDLSFGDVQEELRAFLRPIYEAPPERREPSLRPLCAPTESDPTGATSALSWMPVPDARAALLLGYVRDCARADRVPVAAAQDLVARISLAYRNRAFGRGQHEGRYMSPCSADDLSQILVQRHGAPLSHTEQPVRTLVLSSGMQSNTASAAASTAVGLAALAVTGVGWTQRARKTVPDFACMLADTGSFTSYRLLQSGTNLGLHRKVPGWTDDLQHDLMRFEEAMLARRCVHGWNLPPLQLMQADDADLAARIREVVGDFDPAVLAPR